MRWTLMIAIVLTIGIALPATVTGEGPIPTDDSPVVYLHMDTEESDSTDTEYDEWANANMTDAESVDSHHANKVSTIGMSELLYFWIREGPTDETDLDEPLYFSENESVMNFTVHLEFQQGAPDDIAFELYNWSDSDADQIDQEFLNYSEDGIYEGAFHIPGGKVIPAGNGLCFEISWWMDIGANEWTFHLNNESFTEIPIAADTDDDGIPDYLDDDNGTVVDPDPSGPGTTNTTSTGSTEDGFPPVFGVIIIAVIATAIIIAVRRY